MSGVMAFCAKPSGAPGSLSPRPGAVLPAPRAARAPLPAPTAAPGSRGAPAVLSPSPGCGRRRRLFLLGRRRPAPGRLGTPSRGASGAPRGPWGSRRVPGPVGRAVRTAERAAAAAAVAAAAAATGPAARPLHGFLGPGDRPCLVSLRSVGPAQPGSILRAWMAAQTWEDQASSAAAHATCSAQIASVPRP